MYDGTITISDPDVLESWDVDGYDNIRAYLVRDTDAEPPDGDGIGYVFRISDTHTRYDDTAVSGDYGDTDAGAILTDTRAAWDRFRDWTLVGRYLSMWHDAAAVDTLSRRDDTAVAVVTRSQLTAWGCESDAGPDAVKGALEQYRAWGDGEVYGVRVVNTDTGAEDSLWGLYDDTDGSGSYFREVADDMAGPVERDGWDLSSDDTPAWIRFPHYWTLGSRGMCSRGDCRTLGTGDGANDGPCESHPDYVPAHADYPHEPGRLYDCPACESACHCVPGYTVCVFDGDHNGTAVTDGDDTDGGVSNE